MNQRRVGLQPTALPTELQKHKQDANEKIEGFEYQGKKITNFEMESSAVAGLSKLLGHKALTVCMVIANRKIKEANTGYKNQIEDLIKIVLENI